MLFLPLGCANLIGYTRELTMSDNQDPDWNKSNSSNNRAMINKSHPSIHFTLDPKVTMTGAAAKGLNAVIYAMQRQARTLADSISEYHAQIGKGNSETVMALSEFSKLVGFKGRNYEALRETIMDMGEMKVTWSNGMDGKDGAYGFHNLFVSAKVEDGKIRFVIPCESRELFINDKNVAVIDFMKVNDCLSSKYSIFLHDLIEEQMTQQIDQSAIALLGFSNEELRNGLKVPYEIVEGKKQYSYPIPSKFIDKVLKPAIKEYNEADMKYRVVDFRHERGKIWYLEVSPVSKSFLRALEVQRPDELLDLITALKRFGLNDAKRSEITNEIANEKEFAYLQYCVELTKEKSTAKSGQQGGYFLSVMKNNSDAFDKIWEDKCRIRALESEVRRRAEQDAIEKQKSEYRAQYIKDRIDRYLSSVYQDDDQLDDLIESVLVHLHESAHPLYKRYKLEIEAGKIPSADDPTVRIVAQQRLDISEKEITAYVNIQPIVIHI